MRATDIQDLVRRLLTHEAAESRDQATLVEAAERVTDRLRAYLSNRIGREGFRTLLARSVILAKAQFPQLGAVRVEADGSLVGLRGAAGTSGQDTQDSEAEAPDNGTWEDPVEAAVALVAHLLALLFTFIGEDLTLRMLGTVWPELALDDATGPEDARP